MFQTVCTRGTLPGSLQRFCPYILQHLLEQWDFPGITSIVRSLEVLCTWDRIQFQIHTCYLSVCMSKCSLGVFSVCRDLVGTERGVQRAVQLIEYRCKLQSQVNSFPYSANVIDQILINFNRHINTQLMHQAGSVPRIQAFETLVYSRHPFAAGMNQDQYPLGIAVSTEGIV